MRPYPNLARKYHVTVKPRAMRLAADGTSRQKKALVDVLDMRQVTYAAWVFVQHTPGTGVCLVVGRCNVKNSTSRFQPHPGFSMLEACCGSCHINATASHRTAQPPCQPCPPTFQAVNEKVFPALPITMLRFNMPGKLRRLTCSAPPNT